MMTTCEYLLDDRLCKAIIEGEEGRTLREDSCANEQKDICCYLCDNQSSCNISCDYIGEPKDTTKKSQVSGRLKRLHPMTRNTDPISSFESQTMNIGYYSGLTFGIGYSLTIAGVIAIVAELLLRFFSLPSSYPSYIPSGFFSSIPSWVIASLVILFISVMCAITFGLSVVKDSKSVRDSGLKINAISSSINAFAFMLIFLWIGTTILSAGFRLSLFSPICGIAGGVLLFVGFKAYRSESSQSKLMGAVLMLISVALTYFVAFKGSGLNLLGAGPLFSEFTLETVALIIALIGAAIFAFPIIGEHRLSVAAIILSISAIIFSSGIMYFTFSNLSSLNRLLSLAGTATLLIPSLSGFQLYSVYVLFLGFLVLGISGIITLIAACLPLVSSFKELTAKRVLPQDTSEVIPSVQPVAAAKTPTETAQFPRPEERRFCRYCGAKNETDAVFCERCGKKIG